MSKIGNKRSKASVVEIQENIHNRQSRMDSNTLPNSSEDLNGKESNDDGNTNKEKGQGLSKFHLISGHLKPKELQHNEYGQPIGDNSVKYPSFLGCMVKEFVPYILHGWNEIDEEVKNKVWSCLQLNYHVEENEKKLIFQKLAKLWRDKKSKLQILVRQVNHGRVGSQDLNLLKPEFMDQEEWDLFVKNTLSDAFHEKTCPVGTEITRSKVWIESHKKKNGQPSSEAVGEKMKEIEECPLESQYTTNIADDVISLVFGKEARGRVRGMGFGVTPSKVGASVQQNGIVKQLRCKVYKLEQEIQ